MNITHIRRLLKFLLLPPAIFLFPAIAVSDVPDPAADKPALSASLNLLAEARRLCQSRALHPPGEDLKMIRDVRGYLRAVDPYSTYISPAELQVLAELDKPDYPGVGMEVIAGTKGGIFCIPYSAGPAHTAGIQPGDRLMAVDGKSVANESPDILPVMVRGPAGSQVTLKVLGYDGRERETTITRAEVHRPIVEVTADEHVLKIRIYRFEDETPELVRRGLASAMKHKKVIIDLRGNIGGELKAAVDTASFFLPANTLIATVYGRPDSGAKPVYHPSVKGGQKFLDRKIIIWQDQMTASASELFIMALIDKGKAVNVGRRTFGKGRVQEVFSASDGGVFIITTGEIIPPDGRSFDGQGIEPRLLIRDSDDESDFMRRTEEAFSSL